MANSTVIGTAIMVALLPLLVYSAFTDHRERTVNTLPFLIFDVALSGYLFTLNVIFLTIMAPIISEYLLSGRKSYIPYLLLLIIFILPGTAGAYYLSMLTYAITILTIKLTFTVMRYGTGDTKILETVTMAIPALIYMKTSSYNLIIPSGYTIIILAGIILVVATYAIIRPLNHLTGWRLHVNPADILPSDVYKFRVSDGKATYLAPFVVYATISYAIVAILVLFL